ncbi:MAG: hypothetical protein NTY02_06160 [Acidobacteria bacterium]|nr:hypothetical protein [Acidobacteriota bacterium]
MSQVPAEVSLEIRPRARFDAIDVRSLINGEHGDVLAEFPHALYCSFHTTAGYLDQGLATRLSRNAEHGVDAYIDAFRSVFPEDAGYLHDNLELRTELTDDQKAVEPRNADSHLAFMAAGMHACVSYRSGNEPVWFVDLDGVNEGQPRRRQTTVVGYTHEVPVWHTHVTIPVSGHPIDSVNLRHPQIGFYEMLDEAIKRYGVTKGRLRIELDPAERQAGLTINEYETLLMRHDLVEVLRDPLRFMAEKGRHAWADPRSIPAKTLGYAKYDIVRVINSMVDRLGLNEGLIERMMARVMALPAERFLRMKRSVNLLVSDRQSPGHGTIVQGTYQSPILVQWDHASNRTRTVHITLARLV